MEAARREVTVKNTIVLRVIIIDDGYDVDHDDGNDDGEEHNCPEYDI